MPPCVSGAGLEAVELSARAGLHLDPWEARLLSLSLGERADGKWAAFEVGLMVSRQNGKGAILEARELAALFLLDERLIIHSAHQFSTSLEHFRRLLYLVESTPDLDREVRRVSRSHGEEGVELKNGKRIAFRTRTKGGGRGFSSDLLVLDEAMDLQESAHGALLPTLSARPNPQVWYTGSAVDQWTHDNGVVFARLRERGQKGDDPALAYFEWSVDADDPSEVDEAVVSDPRAWALANPGLGIRISEEHVEREQRSMDPRTFAVERLGIGDWPATDPSGGWQVISAESFAACRDADSVVVDPVQFAFDVTPDRSAASIGVAGLRADGVAHVEVVEHKSGTNWVAPRMAELIGKHDCGPAVCDGKGPAAALLAAMAQNGVEVDVVSASEYSQACGGFFDAVKDREVRHLGDRDLADAVKGAMKRPLGDAWAWSRKTSSVDISPLVAVTLALRAHAKLAGSHSREAIFI